MTKLLTILVAIVLLNCRVSSEESGTAQGGARRRDPLLKRLQQCTSYSNTNIKLGLKVYLMEPLTERSEQCLRACIWEQMKVIGGNGELLVAGFTKYLRYFHIDLESEATIIHPKCNSKERPSERCAAAEQQARCVRNELELAASKHKNGKWDGEEFTK